jgi:hypothetical protein
LKRIVIIGVTLVAALAVVLLVWHGRTLTSSHHAVIRVRIGPPDIHGELYTKQRQSRVDRVLPKLASILHEAGLIAVTDANTPFNTTTFGNNQDDFVGRRSVHVHSEAVHVLVHETGMQLDHEKRKTSCTGTRT